MSELISGLEPTALESTAEAYINNETIPIPEPKEPTIIELKNKEAPLQRLRISGKIITNE